jgi:hypothetical protein
MLDDIESYWFVCLPIPDLNFVFVTIVISLGGNHLHLYTNLITHYHQSKITLNSSLNQNVTGDPGNACCLEKEKTYVMGKLKLVGGVILMKNLWVLIF